MLDWIIDPTDIKVWWSLRWSDTRLPQIVFICPRSRRHELDIISPNTILKLLGHFLDDWVDRVHQVEHKFR